METFTAPKELVKNPLFHSQKQTSLASLNDNMIDDPIVDIINYFNCLSYCYTLQCCYGHFLYGLQQDSDNLEPLPAIETTTRVEYRIAYLAFCIEKNDTGRQFMEILKRITVLDPDNIQFCSAEWFWNKRVNSYALQVEPDRFKYQDTAILDYAEARHVEAVRNVFYDHIRGLDWRALGCYDGNAV